MLFERKPDVVEARIYDGPPLRVVNDQLGEQLATSGMYLVGSERGKIRAVSADAFLKDYQPVEIDDKPTESETA